MTKMFLKKEQHANMQVYALDASQVYWDRARQDGATLESRWVSRRQVDGLHMEENLRALLRDYLAP